MSNSKTEQLYEDFQYSQTGLDSVFETAVTDLEKLIDETKIKAKSAHKRYSQFDEAKKLSDRITEIFRDFGEKVAKGFNEASQKMQHELAPVFADVCIATIEMNPQNTKEIKNVIDGIVAGYDNNPQPDIEVYKSLQKIYASAFRNTGNKDYAKAANRLDDKVGIIKGTATPNTFLKRLLGDNPKANDLHGFVDSLQYNLKNNPEQSGRDLFGYIKEIANIKNNALREQAFEIVLQNLKKVMEASVKEASKSKAEMDLVEKGMFKIFELESVVGLAEKAEAGRTPFERHVHDKYKKEVKVQANQAKIAKQIYTLLNTANKALGVEHQKGKSFYPSKKDMVKVANLLEQCKNISYAMSMDIITKIDDKTFSNVDDQFIDKIMNLKGENADKLKENMTQYRAQMHAKGIKSKVQSGTKAVDAQEKKNPPTAKIVFDVNDLKGNIIEK